MTTDFTLKAVVDFLEANGFLVRGAEEIGPALDPFEFLGLTDKEIEERQEQLRERGVEAIRVVITPKAKG